MKKKTIKRILLIVLGTLGLIVVPNPSDGNFSLLFNLKSTEDLMIEILDLSGKVIQSKNLGKTFAGHQNIDIDANQLNSGFYFCRLSTSKGSFTKKISIVR
jgi:flagellar hook assembly protein FlgD